MPTSIEHCNRALNMIGSGPIASFLETSDKARTCSAQYEDTVKLLLTMANWRFATRKAQLSRLLDPPLSIYRYAYQLPSAMLAGPDAVYNSAGIGSPPIVQGYEVFERTLLTDLETVYIDYRFRPLESNWPAWFDSLMTLALAAKFAKGVTDQTDLAIEYFQRAFGTPQENMRGGYFLVCTQINRQGGGPKQLPTAELLSARNSL